MSEEKRLQQCEHKHQQLVPVEETSSQLATPHIELPEMFANQECTNCDLLVVSRRTVKYPAIAIGACLTCLEDMEIQEVEEHPEIPKLTDKVYQLLLTWKYKERGNATWASLVRCLHSLEDGDLMEKIQAYLHKKHHGMILSL